MELVKGRRKSEALPSTVYVPYHIQLYISDLELLVHVRPALILKSSRHLDLETKDQILPIAFSPLLRPVQIILTLYIFMNIAYLVSCTSIGFYYRSY